MNFGTSPSCLVCESDEGFLKSYEFEDGGIKNAVLYHPICAMSFPDTFALVATGDSVNFKLRDLKSKLV